MNILRKAFPHIIGWKCNTEGARYCTIYNSEKLMDAETTEIRNEYLKTQNVWDQVSFLPLSKALTMTYEEHKFELLETVLNQIFENNEGIIAMIEKEDENLVAFFYWNDWLPNEYMSPIKGVDVELQLQKRGYYKKQFKS